MMKASDECIDAIKRFKGCRLKAYKCPAGVWTIGYGHTTGVHDGQVITEAQAESLLRGDLLTAELYLSEIRQIDTQGKFDACVDFCFNLGQRKLLNSTLLAKISVHASDDEIAAQFRRLVYANGKKLNGLVKRREWEVQQWLK